MKNKLKHALILIILFTNCTNPKINSIITVDKINDSIINIYKLKIIENNNTIEFSNKTISRLKKLSKKTLVLNKIIKEAELENKKYKLIIKNYEHKFHSNSSRRNK